MRVAVVVPRFGGGIVGGAERLAAGFALAAAARGWQVEVWTTCASDHYGWRNDLDPGISSVSGVTVRRFPIEVGDVERYLLTAGAMAHGRMPSADVQYDWLHYGAHSPALYDHIATASPGFDYVIGIPYAMPLVHYALHACRCRAVAWPCLHDEPMAYFEPTRLLLESVHGVFFNSPEEAALSTEHLRHRAPRRAVVGAGVETATAEAAPPVPERSRLREPYVVYAGRLEDGKGLGFLYEAFAAARSRGLRVRLALMGGGPLKPPRDDGFVWLGRLSEQEKTAVMGRAVALCQPSLNESFSFAIMESWAAGRPVLVHAGCPVTSGHVRRSCGGLWFGNSLELGETVAWLAANPALAARMGEAGRRYVRANYTWEQVMARVAGALERWRAT